jgi:hypothetical protein
MGWLLGLKRKCVWCAQSRVAAAGAFAMAVHLTFSVA